MQEPGQKHTKSIRRDGGWNRNGRRTRMTSSACRCRPSLFEPAQVVLSHACSSDRWWSRAQTNFSERSTSGMQSVTCMHAYWRASMHAMRGAPIYLQMEIMHDALLLQMFIYMLHACRDVCGAPTTLSIEVVDWQHLAVDRMLICISQKLMLACTTERVTHQHTQVTQPVLWATGYIAKPCICIIKTSNGNGSEQAFVVTRNM